MGSLSKRFQLPRIAKPSGTFAEGVLAAGDLLVSTSPDSKTIRNFAVIAVDRPGPLVSTSPDSKTIRNGKLQHFGRALARAVSTSPDSKTIRNDLVRSEEKVNEIKGFNFPG